MGIDYQHNYGIGYEVVASSKLLEEEEDLEFGLEGYLEAYVGEGFTIFSTNSGYGTEVEGIYIVMDKPFSKGLALTWTRKALEYEMTRLGVEPVGELDVVGGMYVY